MKMNEFKQETLSKISISEKEFEEIKSEQMKFIQNLIDSEVLTLPTPEEQESLLIRRMVVALRKIFMIDAEDYEGIIFGYTEETDYGLKNKYDKIIEQYKNSDDNLKNNLIQMGLINEQGIPLYNKENTKTEWKIGKPIDLKNIKERNAYGVFRKKGEIEYYPTSIKITQDELEKKIPLFCTIEAKFQGKVNNGILWLNTKRVTNYKIIGEKIKYSDFLSLIEKHYIDSVINASDKDFFNKIKEKDKKNIFIVDGYASNCYDSNEKINHFEISPLYEFNKERITVFLSKEHKMPSEAITKIIVFGKVNFYNENLSIRGYGVFSEVDFDLNKLEENIE